MTHHTDAERAEFEEIMRNSQRYKAELLNRVGDSYEFDTMESAWQGFQLGIQAARRAAAVPVLQGCKPVPVELLERIQESLGLFVSDQGWSQSDMDTADALDGLLAAAPQPPEAKASVSNGTFAAPVQMPEPAEFQVRIRPTWDAKHNWTIWEKCTPEAAADYERTPLLHEWEYEVRKLYTEQQVRQLLANHGIQEKQG